MEWHKSSVLVSLLATTLVCLIAAFLVMRKAFQKRKCKQLPPGPRGLPLIGHLHLLGKRPHRVLFELSKVHGPLISLRLGSVPLIVASNPEMARQILQTHDLDFSHRLSTAVPRQIFGGCRDIAFAPPDAHWKLMRRLFATELVSTKGFELFRPVRAEEIRALMQSVLVESRMDASRPQELRPKLTRATNNTIMRIMLGKRFSDLELAGGRQAAGDLEGKQKRGVAELLEEILELLGVFNVGDYFPWLAWMDLQGYERRAKRLAAEMRALFEGIIQTRRLANKLAHARPPSDYLDVLLQASESSHIPIHIIEVLVDLFAAGTDTSTSSIEWVLAQLLSNPEHMRKVQAEIDEVVGRERVVEEEDIDRLPFLVACVKETMRLHPAVPFLSPRVTHQACEVLGFHIPAQAQCYVNSWAIGRDPNVWENPTKFSPERFLEANSVDVQGQHFQLLPFGSGRRICPGWKMGLLSVNMILARLLQGFEWSIPLSHHLDLSECFHLSLCLATPLVACATPRLPKELY